jgi:hypothetical protein
MATDQWMAVRLTFTFPSTAKHNSESQRGGSQQQQQQQ